VISFETRWSVVDCRYTCFSTLAGCIVGFGCILGIDTHGTVVTQAPLPVILFEMRSSVVGCVCRCSSTLAGCFDILGVYLESTHSTVVTQAPHHPRISNSRHRRLHPPYRATVVNVQDVPQRPWSGRMSPCSCLNGASYSQSPLRARDAISESARLPIGPSSEAFQRTLHPSCMRGVARKQSNLYSARP
jgi:hypothetical protein